MGARITLSSCLITLKSLRISFQRRREREKKERRKERKEGVKETTNRQPYIRIILAFESEGSNVFDQTLVFVKRNASSYIEKHLIGVEARLKLLRLKLPVRVEHMRCNDTRGTACLKIVRK